MRNSSLAFVVILFVAVFCGLVAAQTEQAATTAPAAAPATTPAPAAAEDKCSVCTASCEQQYPSKGTVAEQEQNKLKCLPESVSFQCATECPEKFAQGQKAAAAKRAEKIAKLTSKNYFFEKELWGASDSECYKCMDDCFSFIPADKVKPDGTHQCDPAKHMSGCKKSCPQLLEIKKTIEESSAKKSLGGKKAKKPRRGHGAKKQGGLRRALKGKGKGKGKGKKFNRPQRLCENNSCTIEDYMHMMAMKRAFRLRRKLWRTKKGLIVAKKKKLFRKLKKLKKLAKKKRSRCNTRRLRKALKKRFEKRLRMRDVPKRKPRTPMVRRKQRKPMKKLPRRGLHQSPRKDRITMKNRRRPSAPRYNARALPTKPAEEDDNQFFGIDRMKNDDDRYWVQ